MVRSKISIIVASCMLLLGASANAAEDAGHLSSKDLALAASLAHSCGWDRVAEAISFYIGAMRQLDRMDQVKATDVNSQIQCQNYDPKVVSRLKIVYGKMKRLYYINEAKKAAFSEYIREMNPIYSACKKRWGTDYEMLEYCIEKQNEAKQRLGIQ